MVIHKDNKIIKVEKFVSQDVMTKIPIKIEPELLPNVSIYGMRGEEGEERD